MIYKQGRIQAYFVLFFLLCLGCLFLQGSTWIGSKELHTTMESVATMLALSVGFLSLIRYYSKQESIFLLIGLGFIGTGLLDGYHAVVTSVFFDSYFPSAPPSLIPWSWIASRLFLSVLIFCSWWVWYLDWKNKNGFKLSDKWVYVLVSMSTLASFLFFAFVPLPRAYYPEFFLHRPEELIPAIFLIAALIGYLKKGRWAVDVFEHWLVISLIVGVVSQLAFMSFSGQIFDMEFDVAHMLKKVSYLCVLIGLNISIYFLYKKDEKQRKALISSQQALKKANMALQDASRLKSEFLANMSHEFRTPMNSIIGFTDRVIKKSSDVLPERQLNNLFIVERNAQNLLALINDLLDISKIESGRMEVFIESFDLTAVINEVIVLSQPMADFKEVTLKVDAPVQSLRIDSDEQKIRHILINLISNAIKFTENGDVTLQVEILKRSGSENDQICLRVIDTGIGIEKTQLAYIFDAFRQADNSSVNHSGGTGLGLTICQNFALMLQGDIKVESEVGNGSTFVLTLPMSMDDSQADESDHHLLASHTSGEGPLVLCIDDNPESIEMLRVVLMDEGYKVTGATTAKEGLLKAKELLPFAITLDILLKDRDGWQVLQELKEDPATRRIPVIMVSVLEDRNWGYRLGASEYIQKPIINSELILAVDRLRNLKTALVVDDDVDIRDLLTQHLEDENLYVKTAGNGQEALDILSTATPDLIVLDLVMPVMDGFELIDALQNDDDFKDIPVIVLTVRNLSKAEKNHLQDRVLAVMNKSGIPSEELMVAVKKQINKLVEGSI